MLKGTTLPLLLGGITGSVMIYLVEVWLLQNFASHLSLIIFVLVTLLVILVALVASRLWQDRMIEGKVRSVLPNLSPSRSNLIIYIQSLIAAFKASRLELRNYQKVIEEQNHQNQLREKLLSAILGSLDVPLIILDHDAKIIEFNREAENLFGYERSYVLEKNPQEILLLEILTNIYSKGWNTELTAHAPDLLKQPIKTLGQNRRGMKIPCKAIIQQLEQDNDRLFVVQIYSSSLHASNTGFIDPHATAFNS